MDTASQWPQNIMVKAMEELGTCPKPSERKATRPHKEQLALNCPRCNSTNTKFCYYNNYSLSQPRYFCKTCRRYWTDGGSLRSIPVGGGSRKHKRSSSSYNSNYHSSNKQLPDLVPPPTHHFQNPKTHNNNNNNDINNNLLRSQDLDLGFSIHRNNRADLKSITEMIQAPSFELGLQNPNSSSSSSRGFNDYAFVPVNVGGGAGVHFGSGFPNLGEFNKSAASLNFSLLDHGLGGGNYGGFQGVQGHNGNNNSSKVLFPFEDLKQDHDHSSNTNEQDGNNRNGDPSTGYWTGVIGGGGSW